MNDLVPVLIIVALVIALIVGILYAVAGKLKGGYGGVTSMIASTYEFLDKDRREAAEEIVEMKANKKMSEEESGRLKE